MEVCSWHLTFNAISLGGESSQSLLGAAAVKLFSSELKLAGAAGRTFFYVRRFLDESTSLSLSITVSIIFRFFVLGTSGVAMWLGRPLEVLESNGPMSSPEVLFAPR